MKRVLLFSFLFAIVTSLSAAPIIATPGIGVGKGEFFALVSGSVQNYQSDHLKKRVEAENTLFSYGISENFFVLAVVPFLYTRAQSTSGEEVISRKSNGLSDLVAVGSWRFFHRNWIGSTLRIFATAGVQAPTGEWNESDLLGVLPRGLQPGTGNWGIPLQLFFTWQTQRHECNAYLYYLNYFTGHNYRSGNTLQGGLQWNTTLFPWRIPQSGYYSELLITLELGGAWTDKSIENGVAIGNSGGSLLTLTPGLRYNHKYFTLVLACICPLHSTINEAPELPRAFTLQPWQSWIAQIGFRY